MERIKTYVIDLFCGAGGTSTAIFKSNTDIEVVACINHDKNAIISHLANHPNCIHFIEDIRTIALKPLVDLIIKLRAKSPNCKIAIWASLECTNYSKAKGGLPRDADSRSLADHLFRYIEMLNPDFLWIENVMEFMAWGPLDKNGRPISRDKGKDYIRWVNQVKSYGFAFDYRKLNSADYGGVTIRTRYFAQFSKDSHLISWPEPTHSKKPNTGGLFEALKPWRAVKEVLDLNDHGNSIFTRKKPLSENTLKRIYAGLVKFVAKGDESFIKRYNGGNPMEKVKPMNSPIGSVSTNGRHAIVKANFLTTYYGNGNEYCLKHPCPSVTTRDRFNKIEVHFFANDYFNVGWNTLINGPSGSILTPPKQYRNTCPFIDEQFGNSTVKPLSGPMGTLTANPKFNLVTPWLMDTNFSNIGSKIEGPSRTIVSSRRHQYLVNPQYHNKGNSIEKPCFTLIARMDKRPPSITTTEKGGQTINVYCSDSEMTVKIKFFMAFYGISDIKMRMLKIDELLSIQGFPKDYKLIGTKTEQKKFIGNSVEVFVGIALFRAIDKAIQLSNKSITAA